MHYSIQYKSGITVFALLIFISVNAFAATATDKLYPGNERDSLSSSRDSANMSYRDSVSFDTKHNSETVSSIHTGPHWYSMVTNLPDDMVGFYQREFTLKKVPLYIGIGALTTGLILTDNQTWKASDKIYKKSGFYKSASDIFVEVGDGRSQFGLAAAFALYGLIENDSRALITASEVVEAVLASGAVVQVLKHITGRESPYVSTKPGGAWRFFPNQIQYHKHVPAFDAYPSGHLTTSLAAFIVIAENYPEAKWIMPVCYTTEGLLAISMVNTGIHWYSDYPLAVFLGYEFGKIISHHGFSFIDSKKDEKKPQLVLEPYFNQSDGGLSFFLIF